MSWSFSVSVAVDESGDAEGILRDAAAREVDRLIEQRQSWPPENRHEDEVREQTVVAVDAAVLVAARLPGPGYTATLGGHRASDDPTQASITVAVSSYLVADHP